MAGPNRNGSVHPVDEAPKPGILLILGLQHLFIMYAGAVSLPYVIGAALGAPSAEIAQMVSANTLFAGVGTVLTTVGIWRIGARLPIVLSTLAAELRNSYSKVVYPKIDLAAFLAGQPPAKN